MGISTSNPVSVDNATKKDDYDVAFNNTVALKERRGQLELGGDPFTSVDDTAFVDIPGVVHAQVDGSNFSGFTIECHFMCLVAAGTGTFRLYNVTDTAEVASSQKTFTNTSADRIVTSTLTLASASKEYKAQVKGSAATTLPRIWDAQIVIR